MRQLSLWEGYDSDGDTLGYDYLNWDADAIQGCFCDWGYGGPDCSLKLCPRGDDPITKGGQGAVVHAFLSDDSAGSRTIVGASVQKEGSGYVNPTATVTATGPAGDGASVTGSGATATVQTTPDGNITSVTITAPGSSYYNASIAITDVVQVDRKIRLSLSASEALTNTGSVRLRFGGFWGDLALGASSSACEAAWESLANIEDVTCTFSDPAGDNNAQYDVEFHAFTEWPVYYNNIHYHDGNPPISQFSCDIEHFTAAGATCVFSDLNAAEGTANTVKEWAVCSNRGICDTGSGVCKCFDGMGGPGKSRACSQVENQLTKTCGGTEISPGHSPPTHDPRESQLELNAWCLGYTGSVLDVDSRRGSSARFQLIEFYARRRFCRALCALWCYRAHVARFCCGLPPAVVPDDRPG